MSGIGRSWLNAFVMAVALAAGASMTEAARLANQAAGIVVGKLGTATADANEVLQSLE